MQLTAQAPRGVGAGASGRGRRRGRAGAARPRRVLITSWTEAEGRPESAVAGRELEDLWDRHGESSYTLACALLGDQTAAVEVVRLAMADLACSVHGRAVSTEEARRCLVRHVYRHAQQAPYETSGAVLLPPVMVSLSQLARLQRESLALCLFGGLTHRETAALLDVPLSTVADLLTTGLRKLGRLAADAPAACA